MRKNYGSGVAAKHAVEVLERRLAPTGVVMLTTSGGVLSITGDGGHNVVYITDSPETGEWLISDPGELLPRTQFILNGVTQSGDFSIPAQSSIKAKLGDGDDELRILPSSTGNPMQVSGGMTLGGGNGHDFIYFGDKAPPSGATTSAQVLLTGPVTIDLGNGFDILDVNANGVYSGVFKVLGGADGDYLRIGATAVTSSFLSGLSIDTGKGLDYVACSGAEFSVGGKLSVAFGSGEVTDVGRELYVDADLFVVDGAASFSSAGGAWSVVLGEQIDVLQFGTGLKITGSNDGDLVKLDGDQTYGAAVVIDLKDGANQTTLQGPFDAPALTIKGGTGTDAVSIISTAEVRTGSALTLGLGNGANTWNVGNGSTLIAGSLSFTGGSGQDTVDYLGADLRVLGAATVNLGDGANSVSLKASMSGAIGGMLTVTGGKGEDAVSIEGPEFRIGGGIKASLGGGGNSLVTSGTLLQVSGAVVYSGGSGDDGLGMSNERLLVARNISFAGGGAPVLGAGDSLSVTPTSGSVGSVSYAGGAGPDNFILGNYGALFLSDPFLNIQGGVSVILGSGIGSVAFGNAVVKGAVAVSSPAGPADTSSLQMFRSTFNGAVTIGLGSGGSSADVRDSTFRSNFTLNTGAGEDYVYLDGSVGGANSWFGLVRIITSGGPDMVDIGSIGENRFYRDITIDGGAGSDSLMWGANTFFGSAKLIPIGIESGANP